MSKRSHAVQTHQNDGLYASTRWPTPDVGAESISAICRQLGPVVYFIRRPDGLIKIGFSDHALGQRKRAAAPGMDWTAILALTPGSLDTERAFHDRLAAHLAIPREIFYPHPDVFEAINEIRQRMGLSSVAA